MRHTALGFTFAHNSTEVENLLIQEAGCEPSEAVAEMPVEKVSVLLKEKSFRCPVLEKGTDDLLLYIEADSEEEVMRILHASGVPCGHADENGSHYE